MHHHVIVKIKGDNEDSARQELDYSYIDNYAGKGKPYDYASESEVITDKDVLKDFKDTGCKNLKELEAYYRKRQKEEVVEARQTVREEILQQVLQKHMRFEDAPTYINDDHKMNVTPTAKALLDGTQKEVPINYPNTPEGLVDFLMPFIFENARDINYAIESYSDTEYMADNPTDYDFGFMSTDAIFVDLTKETEGKKVFFFVTDRHY